MAQIEDNGRRHRAEAGRYYNEGQIDARSTTIKAAYKIARQMILEVAK